MFRFFILIIMLIFVACKEQEIKPSETKLVQDIIQKDSTKNIIRKENKDTSKIISKDVLQLDTLKLDSVKNVLPLKSSNKNTSIKVKDSIVSLPESKPLSNSEAKKIQTKLLDSTFDGKARIPKTKIDKKVKNFWERQEKELEEAYK